MCEKILNFCEEKVGKTIENIDNSNKSACNILEKENLAKNLDNLKVNI
jgi:hypothetical protein